MAFKSKRHRKWYFANKKKGTLPSRSNIKGYSVNSPAADGSRDKDNFVTPLYDFGGFIGPISASESKFFRF